MKKNLCSRIGVLFLGVCLLCSLFLLPGAAEEIELPEITQPSGEVIDEIVHLSDLILKGDGLVTVNHLLSKLSMGILLVIVAGSLLIAFFGHRLLKIAVAILCFTAGWIAGMMGYTWLVDANWIPGLADVATYIPYLVYALCGLLASLLVHKLIKTGIFIAATAGAFLFLSGISDLINPLVDLIYDGDLAIKYLIARILLSLVVGLLSRALVGPVLIATTAAAGGMMASAAMVVCLGQTAYTNVEMIAGILLTLVGIIVQIGFEKKRKK